MYKVKKIIEVVPYSITCELNNGVLRKVDMKSIFENHSHLNGIKQLKNENVFKSVAIGEMGEIFWKDIIISKSNEKWNYDISPEYIYYHGTTIE